MKRKVSDAEWLRLITAARQSGMSDRAWCASHDIWPTTFYRAVKRLRNKAIEIPESKAHRYVPIEQEVVQIAGEDFDPEPLSLPVLREQVITDTSEDTSPVRISVNSDISIEIKNNASTAVVGAIIRALREA